MRQRLGLVVVCLGALFGYMASGFVAVPAAQTERPDRSNRQSARNVDGEILVRFRRGAPAFERAVAHGWARARTLRTFRHVDGLELVRLGEGISVHEAINLYRRHPDVLYAEPNHLVRAADIPNDPRFPEQWGLHNTGQSGDGAPGADIHAPEAWDLVTGSQSVVVAVLDTGIEYTHPDLASNMFHNASDCNADGIDDDKNGYVDDCYGIDVINKDSDPLDDYGHGTQVAGIIGAVGNNALGVVGVSQHVQLLSCKFMNVDGVGSVADAIACLDYVKTMKDRGLNIVATNNSWALWEYSQSLADAIDEQRQRGILFVAAAGNESSDNDALSRYPASYNLPNVLAVAATTSSDGLTSFSNVGRRTVHLGAPGQNILSTSFRGSYQTASGTSMAAPHVSGAAALLKAQDPNRDWRAIKNLILAGGDSVPGLAAFTVTGKRLNAYGALTCAGVTVLAPLQPAGRTGAVGVPLTVAALHINCASPGGNVVVTIDPGGETVTLTDDGLGVDQAAGDGVYSGQWTPPAIGIYSLRFPNGDTQTVRILSPYTTASTPYVYRTIAGQSLALANGVSASIDSPFDIMFGDQAFRTMSVGGNGTLTFSTSFPGDALNEPLATPRIDTLVAPFWDDLSPRVGAGTTQNVFWDVTGSAPNREVVIEWRGVEHSLCPGSAARFEAVFFERRSDVLFNYADTTFGGSCAFADQGGTAVVGVQTSRDSGAAFSVRDPDVADGTALLWTTATVSQHVSVGFAGASSSVRESAGQAGVLVTITTSDGAATTVAGSVNYAMPDGTAHAGSDFASTSGTLSWAARTPSGTTLAIHVPITNDTLNEPSESFFVTLKAPVGVVLGLSRHTVTIVDDDPPPPPTPAIVTQPADQTIASGHRATLSVTATGAAPLTYRWFVVPSDTTPTDPLAGGTSDGAMPFAPVVQGSDGYLYGTTTWGGVFNLGTIFKVSLAGVMTVLHTFARTDGAKPRGGLIQATDGNFYGAAAAGAGGGGLLYRMTPAGVFTVLHVFAGGDGWGPVGNLLQARDGSLYGTAEVGGGSASCPNGCGTIFRITLAGNFSVLHIFSGVPSSDGAYPQSGVIESSDGNFYGTAQGDPLTIDQLGRGTVFRMTPSGTVTVLHTFNGGPDGATPYAGLVEGTDGNLYGATNGAWSGPGGASGYGTLFRMTRSGVFTLLYGFGSGQGANAANSPNGRLLQAADGNFYGTTSNGGQFGCGDVFRMTPAGSVTPLYALTGGLDGCRSQAGLAQGTDGNLYGTTWLGGASNNGAVFRVNLAAAGSTGSIVTPLAVFRPGLQIAGASGSTYTTPLVTNDVSYWVRVSNDYGSVDSNVATIYIGMPAAIIAQPKSSRILSGQTVTLEVAAFGVANGLNGPFTYQWYQGTSGDASHPIAGATGARYTTGPLTSTTTYWVRVSNPYGPSVDSVTATITVGALFGGGKIAFTSTRDGNKEIYVMNADGSSQLRLTNNSAADWFPAWSPDGTKIAFTSNREGRNQVYVMNADGTNQTNCTKSTHAAESPAWSPDGTQIAFTDYREVDPTATDVSVMNASDCYVVAPPNPAPLDFVGKHPAWSPDGTKIVFSANGQLQTSNTDESGADRTLLLDGTAVTSSEPSWSPDGRTIAFTGLVSGSSPQIYVADGRPDVDQASVGIYGGHGSVGPVGQSFIPSASSIGHATLQFFNHSGVPATLTMHVRADSMTGPVLGTSWPVTLSGSYFDTIVRFVFTPAVSVVPGNRYFFEFSSPSELYVGWSQSDYPKGEAYIGSTPWDVDLFFEEGPPSALFTGNGPTGLKALTTLANVDGWSPSFSPDRTQIAFTTSRDGNHEIYVMNVDGTAQTNLTRHAGDDSDPDWQRVTSPAITVQPADQQIAFGATATLCVETAGTGPFTYQWFVGLSGDSTHQIATAIASCFTTPPVTTAVGYWVRVSSANGSVNSTTVVVSIGLPPVIASQPQSQIIAAGQTTTITVAASGTNPLTYQWHAGSRGDVSTPVESTGLSVTPPPLTQDATHWVRVSNRFGTVDSLAATLSVGLPPTITSQPHGPMVPSGQTATLSVNATSNSPLGYQWYVGESGDVGSPVDSARGSSYTTPTMTQTTHYWVRVSTAFGTADSVTAEVSVPAIIVIGHNNGVGEPSTDGFDAITVVWHGVSEPSASDSLTLYAVDNSAGTPLKSWQTGGTVADSFIVSLPSGLLPGQYELRLGGGDGRLLSISPPFALTTPAPGMTVSPQAVETGGALAVDWHGIATPSADDGFGLAQAGSTTSGYLTWQATGGATRGSALLAVPSSLPAGDYEVRLETHDGGQPLVVRHIVSVTAHPTASGVRGGIAITSPPRLQPGGTLTVTWRGVTSPTAWFAIVATDEPDRDYVTGSRQATGGSFEGEIEVPLPPTMNAGLYEVRFFGDSGDRLVRSNAFTVTPTLSVVSPARHDRLLIGGTQLINVHHNLGVGRAVAFDISRDGGAWRRVASFPTSVENAATYPWTVTGPATTHARLRFSVADDPTISIVSDKFAIVAPVVTVTSPNGAGKVVIGSVRPITFTHNLGVGQHFTIEVGRDGVWRPLADVTTTSATSESYLWVVDGPVSSHARVRVRSVTLPRASDVSDVDFRIVPTRSLP